MRRIRLASCAFAWAYATRCAALVPSAPPPVAATTNAAATCTRREFAGRCAVGLLSLDALAWTPEANAEVAATANKELPRPPPAFRDVFAKAGKRALGGGASGALAAVAQILSLMWMRSIMNYQYRYGTTISEAATTLYADGGIPRFYQGLPFALIQGPLSRFGDTAASAGLLVLLDGFAVTAGLPLGLKSAAGSVAAGLWRIVLMPVDACKTVMQVDGSAGLPKLLEKVQESGPGMLYEGALAASVATFVGHFPWFYVYNSLQAQLPPAPPGDAFLALCRSAFIGLCASCVSDCCSNSVRVIKTTKQTSPKPIGYQEAVDQILQADGVAGLLGRGLKTRLLVNAAQGALFAVAWKYFDALLFPGASGGASRP